MKTIYPRFFILNYPQIIHKKKQLLTIVNKHEKTEKTPQNTERKNGIRHTKNGLFGILTLLLLLLNKYIYIYI